MTKSSMDKARVLKAAGFTLVAIGAVLVFVALEGGGIALRIGGPVAGFLGVVLLAQASRRREGAGSP
jgi:hypothetical protein